MVKSLWKKTENRLWTSHKLFLSSLKHFQKYLC